MNISRIANKTITGVKKISNNFCSCPIKLKQLAQDTFTKTQTEDIAKAAKKLNPNTEFLRDPNLTHTEKMNLLRRSPNIFRAVDLSKETGVASTTWLYDKFFDIEHYVPIEPTGMWKQKQKIIDLTNPTNAKNFANLKKVCKGAIDGENFRLSCKMDVKTYQRYVKEGLIEKIQLPHKTTGELLNTGLIDPKNPKNIAAAERFRALCPKDSKFFGQRKINVTDLSKLGYGSPKELANLIKSGEIEGEIKIIGQNEKGQNIIQATVDTASAKTKLLLRNLRERRCIELHDLSQRSGIKETQLENAVLSGEMETVERLFTFDSKNPILDTTNPKNIAAFDKIQFEKKLQREAMEAKTAAKNEEISLRTKLAWYFCPNTRTVARQAFAQSDMGKIQNEITSMKTLLNNPELKPEDVEALEDKLIKLYAQEDTELKKVFGSMWKTAGSDEYKTAIKKAKEIIAQVKTSGINSIQDEGVVAILKAHQG